MGHMQGQAHFEAPIDAVFDVAVDITLMPRYMAAVKDMSPPSGAPEQPGTTYRFHSSFLGRSMGGTVEVLEVQRPTFLRTRTTYDSGACVTWTQRMTPAGNGTDQVDDVDYVLPSGRAWALAAPLIRRQLEGAMRDSVPAYAELIRARAAGR